MITTVRTLDEWIDLYEKKTGEKIDREKGVTFYFPERGFANYIVDKNMIIIKEVCGDGLFWRQVGEILAKERGFSHLGTICLRKNIKAYIRLFGFEITIEEMLPDGKIRYYGKDKRTGKPGRANPSTNDQGYLITWEV